MTDHLTSVRFDEETIAQLKTLSEIQDTSIAEEIRRAVSKYLDDLRSDPEFVASAKEATSRRAERVKQLLNS